MNDGFVFEVVKKMAEATQIKISLLKMWISHLDRQRANSEKDDHVRAYESQINLLTEYLCILEGRDATVRQTRDPDKER